MLRVCGDVLRSGLVFAVDGCASTLGVMVDVWLLLLQVGRLWAFLAIVSFEIQNTLKLAVASAFLFGK